jgi:zinc transporter 1/2/3
MNCPSRTDDDELHPGWNQNPPRFASDLTTCQDMNGIANARELLDGRGNGSVGIGPGDDDLGEGFRDTRPPDRQPATGAGGPQKGKLRGSNMPV